MSELTSPAILRLQKRIVYTLAGAQILGGVGMASGAAVGALLAADLAGDLFAGLSASSSVIGAAFIAIPVTRLMTTTGRRQGLILAYIIGILGALIVILGAKMGQIAIALPGMVLMGGGTTATLQSRYAATDLAQPKNRGRDLSVVVWATTIGSVVGPNLAETMGDMAETVNLPRLAGPYMMTIVVFVAAMVLLQVMLRPDPLVVSEEMLGIDRLAARAKPLPLKDALALILSIPAAKVGLASMALGQAVMTAVMSMTPIHLNHANASLGVIGAIISGHIAGMYIASPVVGIAADRLGRRPVIVTGIVILFTSFLLAGTASGEQHTQLMIGLFLLGLGWSCTMIAGSTLLTESLPSATRPRAQGAADLSMGICGASAGLIAGVVVGFGSYALLNILTTGLMILLTIIVVQERVGTVKSQPA